MVEVDLKWTQALKLTAEDKAKIAAAIDEQIIATLNSLSDEYYGYFQQQKSLEQQNAVPHMQPCVWCEAEKKLEDYAASSDEDEVVVEIRQSIPGLKGARVWCPCERERCVYKSRLVRLSCGTIVSEHSDEFKRKGDVFGVVMHLNDGVKWSREQIADWLDTLDFDIRFQVDDDTRSE